MDDRYLTDLIIKFLYELLPEINCYTDEAWQDDDAPSFFLNLFNVEQSDNLADYFYEVYQYDLLYDPKPSGQPDERCREMAGFLRVNLRAIPELDGSGPIYPYDIRSTTADGLLHVLFNIRREYYIEAPEYPDITEVKLGLTETEENGECILKEKY